MKKDGFIKHISYEFIVLRNTIDSHDLGRRLSDTFLTMHISNIILNQENKSKCIFLVIYLDFYLRS